MEVPAQVGHPQQGILLVAAVVLFKVPAVR
jgi:hypothetical protein